MAKIIKDTKRVSSYSEDYRSGGWSTRTEEAYYCGSCRKELDKKPLNFCPHCGEPLNGVQEEVKKRQNRAAKPYEKAYNIIYDFRKTLTEGSLEYMYVSELIKEIYEDIQCAKKTAI